MVTWRRLIHPREEAINHDHSRDKDHEGMNHASSEGDHRMFPWLE